MLFIIGISIMLMNCTRRSSRGTSSRKNNSEYVQHNRSRNNRYEQPQNRSRGKTTVKMREEGGVYHVPCKINGIEMEFVFDTGASDVTISLTEAMFLYKQNKLTDDDVIGSEYYQIADGSISEGTVVNLKSVTIGDRTIRNVQASIVHNMEAPLLLGQSALSEFGRISIDYKRKEIIFE